MSLMNIHVNISKTVLVSTATAKGVYHGVYACVYIMVYMKSCTYNKRIT